MFDYRSLLGSLLWIAGTTRPDIACAVSMLASFCIEPRVVQRKALLKLLKYTASTKTNGIHLAVPTSEILKKRGTLETHSDSDWAGDWRSDARSRSAYVIKYCGMLIDYRSKKQATVALSSTEAETNAMVSATLGAFRIHQILDFLGEKITKTHLYGDNNASVKLATKEFEVSRTRHVGVKIQWLREKVTFGHLEVFRVSGEENVADLLTKGVSKKVLNKLSHGLVIPQETYESMIKSGHSDLKNETKN